MKIGFLNCDEKLVDLFDDPFILYGKNSPDLDGLVIDWVSRNDDVNFAIQASVVEQYIKNSIPTIIFDRFSSITFKEHIWLKRFNVTTFEPVLNHRDKFKYLPFWIYDLYDISKFDINDREFDLVYKGVLKNKIKSFDSYCVTISTLYPKYNIAISAKLPEEKIRYYMDNNIEIIENLDLTTAKFSIIIGSLKDYRIGKLDQLFVDSFNNGCVPLIVPENRFFASFNVSMKNNSMLRLFLETTHDVRYGMLMGLYDEIGKYFPEMKVNYFVDIINNIANRG